MTSSCPSPMVVVVVLRMSGVAMSADVKRHPVGARHAADRSGPMTLIASACCSIAGGGGGVAGAGGWSGGAYGDEGGGARGGGRGGIGRPGGFPGAGGGNILNPQSAQSEAHGQPSYSAPSPPSSQTPSLVQPTSGQALLHWYGGEGGGGGGRGEGGGGPVGGGEGGTPVTTDTSRECEKVGSAIPTTAVRSAGDAPYPGGGARGANRASQFAPTVR